MRCGLAVVGAIEQLATRVGLEDGTLHVRVGVNTGEAVVHPAPSAGEAMVTGDVVNTAARLQSAAPLNGVLLGPETALAVAHAVELEAAGELELKGKAQPVRASRAVVLLSEPERERAMGQLTAPTIGREAELSRVTRALDRCMVRRVAASHGRRAPWNGQVATARRSRGASRTDAESRFGGRACDQTSSQRFVPSCRARRTRARRTRASAIPKRSADKLTETLGRERAAVVAAEVAALLGVSENVADDRGRRKRVGRPASRPGPRASQLSTIAPSSGCVEDVHWSGSDYRAFLRAATEGNGRLVVCTSRPSLLEADPEWISSGEVLELEPLSPPVDRRARSRARRRCSPRGARRPTRPSDRVVIPLFVEELLRSWVGSGLLEPSPSGWELSRYGRRCRAALDRPERVRGTARRSSRASAVGDPPGLGSGEAVSPRRA